MHKKTGPTLLRNSLTRLWQYNIFTAKPLKIENTLMFFFKLYFLCKMYILIFRIFHFFSRQRRQLGLVKYQIHRLLNVSSFNFLNFRVFNLENIISIFINLGSRTNFFYKKKKFGFFKILQFKVFKTFQLFEIRKKIKKIFFFNFFYKYLKKKTFLKYHKKILVFKKNTIILREKKIQYTYFLKTIRIKKKFNKIPILKTAELLKNFKYLIKACKFFFFINLEKKNLILAYYTAIYRKAFKKKNLLFFSKLLSYFRHQFLLFTLEYNFFFFLKYFLKKKKFFFTLKFQYIFLLPIKFFFRQTIYLDIYKNTSFLKTNTKFYENFLNTIFFFNTFNNIQNIITQLSIEFLRTKKHWKLINGIKQLLTKTCRQLKVAPFRLWSNIIGMKIIIAGRPNKVTRTMKIKIKIGTFKKTTFTFSSVSQIFKEANSFIGSYGIRVIFAT
jgi:hypothetical protein